MVNVEVTGRNFMRTRHRMKEILAAGEGRLKITADYREGNERKEELVLWIHGLGCNKDSFRDAWKVDGLKPFSMLAPDLAGFGDSSKPDDWSYSMESHAASLKELLNQPKYANKRLHIVGHSMGGVPAILLAEQLRGRVASLTLAEGNLMASDCGILSRTSASASGEEFVTDTLPGFKRAFLDSSSEGAKLWVEQVGKVTNPTAFQRSAASLVAHSDAGNLVERVNELRASGIRVQYMYGEHSDQWEASRTALTEEFAPGVKMVPISDAGHFMMNDNTWEFYSKYVQFLN